MPNESESIKNILITLGIGLFVGFFMGYSVMYQVNIKTPEEVLDGVETVINSEFRQVSGIFERDLKVKDVPPLYFGYKPTSRYLLQRQIEVVCGAQKEWATYDEIVHNTPNFTMHLEGLCRNLSITT